MDAPLLQVKNLQIRFRKEGEVYTAVSGANFAIFRDEIFALVGASGSGKSAIASAVLGLHNRHFTQVEGEIIFEGKNLLDMGERELNEVRGKEISMVFQDPLSALNPLMKIGAQIEEVLSIHTGLGRAEKKARSLELLEQVGIKNMEQIYCSFPHQLSGGMRQRVMIAMAISCKPKIVIADEPTTALDATVAVQIMELLQRLQREIKTAVFLITHDMEIVKKYASRVVKVCG
jgi:peptide/nickel transport system ATP-binding protein